VPRPYLPIVNAMAPSAPNGAKTMMSRMTAMRGPAAA
jgi:hypothetical protein